jgi:Flp pilus assembly protein TadG
MRRLIAGARRARSLALSRQSYAQLTSRDCQAPGAIARSPVRQRGQVLAMMAGMAVLLMGTLGIAVDLGFAFAHRRQVESAADAGALAGAEALSRHILWTHVCQSGTAPASAGCTPTDPFPNGSTVRRDIECTAIGSVTYSSDPNAPTLGESGCPNSQVWSSGQLTPYWMLYNAANPSSPTKDVNPISGTAIPANAVGVHVDASTQWKTLLEYIVPGGQWSYTTAGSSRALLLSVGTPPNGSGGPFIICAGSGSNGAWQVSTANGTAQEALVTNLLINPGPQPNPAYWFYTFRVDDSQVGQSNAGRPWRAASACNASGFNGVGNPTAPCVALPGAVNGLPCTAQGSPGTRPGTIVNGGGSGLTACNDVSIQTGCVSLLGMTQGTTGTPSGCSNSSCPITVVAYGCFFLKQVNANTFNATLLPQCSAGETGGSGTIDPSGTAPFIVKLIYT